MAHINWLAVYNHFIANDTTTLADCASKFDIHVDYVRQKASQEQWTSKKLQVRQAALKLMEQQTADEIAKRNEEHAKMGRAIQGVALESLATSGYKPRSFDEIRKGLETGIKIERQALDMDRKIIPNVEISNNEGQRLLITWGDNTPIGEFIKKDGLLQCVKDYNTY